MLKIGNAGKLNYYKYFFALSYVCLRLSCSYYLVNTEKEKELWFGRYEKLRTTSNPNSSGLDTDLLSPKPNKFKSLHELNSAREREIIWFVSVCYRKCLGQIYFTWLWSIHGTTTEGNATPDWLWLLTDLKVKNIFLQKFSHQ